MSRAEVMGLVGGKQMETGLLLCAYAVARAAANSVHCDMDPGEWRNINIFQKLKTRHQLKTQLNITFQHTYHNIILFFFVNSFTVFLRRQF